MSAPCTYVDTNGASYEPLLRLLFVELESEIITYGH